MSSANAPTGAALWDDIVARAAASPRDAALLGDLAFRGHDGNVLSLALKPGAGSGFLRDNVDVVRATIAKIIGRPIEVRLDVEGVAAPKPVAPRGLIPPEVREHPVVKLAADLFDASVVDVTPLRRDEVGADAAAPSFGDGSSEATTGTTGDDQDV